MKLILISARTDRASFAGFFWLPLRTDGKAMIGEKLKSDIENALGAQRGDTVTWG